MASDGPESKAVSQAPDQDGEGESSEQLTKFVSLILEVLSISFCIIMLIVILIRTNSVFMHFVSYMHYTIGGRIARKHGKSERERERGWCESIDLW